MTRDLPGRLLRQRPLPLQLDPSIFDGLTTTHTLEYVENPPLDDGWPH